MMINDQRQETGLSLAGIDLERRLRHKPIL
jgi:hypothetical protein